MRSWPPFVSSLHVVVHRRRITRLLMCGCHDDRHGAAQSWRPAVCHACWFDSSSCWSIAIMMSPRHFQLQQPLTQSYSPTRSSLSFVGYAVTPQPLALNAIFWLQHSEAPASREGHGQGSVSRWQPEGWGIAADSGNRRAAIAKWQSPSGNAHSNTVTVVNSQARCRCHRSCKSLPVSASRLVRQQ